MLQFFPCQFLIVFHLQKGIFCHYLFNRIYHFGVTTWPDHERLKWSCSFIGSNKIVLSHLFSLVQQKRLPWLDVCQKNLCSLFFFFCLSWFSIKLFRQGSSKVAFDRIVVYRCCFSLFKVCILIPYLEDIYFLIFGELLNIGHVSTAFGLKWCPSLIHWWDLAFNWSFSKNVSLLGLDFFHEALVFPESAFFSRIGVLLNVLENLFFFVLILDVDSFEKELGSLIFVFFESEATVSGSEVFELLCGPFFFVFILKCNLEKSWYFMKKLIFLFFLFGVQVCGFEIFGSMLFFKGMVGNGPG